MVSPTDPKPSSELDPRVLLAAERTLLAWIRTGLAMMGFGFVVARFGLFLRELASANIGSPAPKHLRMSQWVGTTLILLGVLVNVLAALQHTRFVHRYAQGQAIRLNRISLGTVVAAILAVLGAALAAYLLGV